MLLPGELSLEESAAHHLRDVLRLAAGVEIELFDDAGATAVGTIVSSGSQGVVVRIARATVATRQAFTLTVASAVPKANRADWMIEKLSELGVNRFIPLQTARSVVHPEGKNKIERWERLAVEAAKQSRRRGVMRVDSLQPIERVMRDLAGPGRVGWYFSTAPGARRVMDLMKEPPPSVELTLIIGPEGGWTEDEIAAFDAAGLIAVALTDTILRIETAALAAAAIVAAMRSTPV